MFLMDLIENRKFILFLIFIQCLQIVLEYVWMCLITQIEQGIFYPNQL